MALSAAAEKQQGQRCDGRQGLHVEDAPGDGRGAEDPRQGHANEEERRTRREVGTREDRPDEPRGEEPVVKTLVLRELRGSLGFFGGHPEQPPRPRAPEEHLEDEEVEMKQGDQQHEDLGDGVRHCERDTTMLRELRVVGYRSLRDVDLSLSPLTVVVGANGSGKTNLYQALQLLSSAAQGSLAQSLAAQGGLPSAMWAGPRRKQEGHRIELSIDLEDLAYDLQLGVIPPPQGPFELDPDVKEERVFVLDGGKRHTVAERRANSAWSRDAEGKRTTFPLQL